MKVFLSGIAGTGMSSLAGLLVEKGFEVSGSDTAFYPPTSTILKKLGIKLYDSFNPSNITGDTDLCVIGNIISRGNPEAEYILNNNMPFMSMPEALFKYFIKGKESIVVSGTHGKTTISGFIAFLLELAGMSPGYFIGGLPDDLGSSCSIGSGKYFVVEGDEYETSFFDRSSKFLKYFPKFLIISALEYDHLDFFKNRSDYLYAFKNLVNQVPSAGKIILNSDFPLGVEAVKNSYSDVVTYGMKNCNVKIGGIERKNDGICFDILFEDEILNFKTPLFGKYNIWNLSAGIILGRLIGIPDATIKQAVSSYKGISRRLKILGTIMKTTFFEDFAHHPSEISAVLSSLKERYPDKELVVFMDTGSSSLRRRKFEENLIESLKYGDTVFLKKIAWKGKIPENERIRQDVVIRKLGDEGVKAKLVDSYKNLKNIISKMDKNYPQTVILLSNGGFGGTPSFVAGEVL